MVSLCTYRVRKCSGLFMYVQSEEVQCSVYVRTE